MEREDREGAHRDRLWPKAGPLGRLGRAQRVRRSDLGHHRMLFDLAPHPDQESTAIGIRGDVRDANTVRGMGSRLVLWPISSMTYFYAANLCSFSRAESLARTALRSLRVNFHSKGTAVAW